MGTGISAVTLPCTLPRQPLALTLQARRPDMFDPDSQAANSPATAITRSAERRARKRLCGLHRLRQLRKPRALALRGGRLAAALAAERLERGARPRARVQRLADRRGYTRVHERAALACARARPPRPA